jgi:hypothetical protein
LGAILGVGCTVSSGDDDIAGAAGEGASGGSSGKGGSAGKGGSTTGGTAGKGGSAGKGGGSGEAGATGATGGGAGTGTSGTGGTDAGSGGMGEAGTSTSGSGGTGGTVPATCDPAMGELPSHDASSCAPIDGATGDDLACQQCMEAKCCDMTRECYGEDPYNVCGWGGPTVGDYAGYNEIGCYVACLKDYVAQNDMTCDAEGEDVCFSECATTMCFDDMTLAALGNATNALVGCLHMGCSDKCFGADQPDSCAF